MVWVWLRFFCFDWWRFGLGFVCCLLGLICVGVLFLCWLFVCDLSVCCVWFETSLGWLCGFGVDWIYLTVCLVDAFWCDLVYYLFGLWSFDVYLLVCCWLMVCTLSWFNSSDFYLFFNVDGYYYWFDDELPCCVLFVLFCFELVYLFDLCLFVAWFIDWIWYLWLLIVLLNFLGFVYLVFVFCLVIFLFVSCWSFGLFAFIGLICGLFLFRLACAFAVGCLRVLFWFIVVGCFVVVLDVVTFSFVFVGVFIWFVECVCFVFGFT